ncbi:LCP family protein [Arcanobacterium hippocoleae]|uniref:LCP family protein required for cell wall assembly n=1 Tax=Arcanobacterium hippocoleae TaxID=149017 RepID=A0ABU1T3I6_9ACTO|nr:LCP family protein [Arcanobacterium hippocoleae]MDR6939952.1 LCP family protein required for cell wall assembly [Arcanobacterium hippocoleae]
MSKTSESGLKPTPHATAAMHQRTKSAWHSIWRVLLAALLAVFLFFSSAFATAYYKLQNSIKQHDISDLFTTKRPEPAIPLDQKAGQPLNILILGSDTRTGLAGYENSHITGMRSDTTMLVHISADRTRVDVVSIPRDTLVDIPSCALPNGKRTNAKSDTMFNSAFTIGGSTGDVSAAATCTLQTVEQLSGVLIDGFVVVNFNSFRDVVNTIGGVEMCFNRNIRDPKAALEISAGCHTLDGDQALGFARARYSVGDGSDLSRIGRQQELVSKIADKIFSLNIFTSIPQLYQLVSSVTKNLDTSAGLGNIDWLAGLMYSLRNLSSQNINFVTMPYTTDAVDRNRVRPLPQAEQVWEALRTDTKIPDSALLPKNPFEDKVTVNPNPDPQTPESNNSRPAAPGADQNSGNPKTNSNTSSSPAGSSAQN